MQDAGRRGRSQTERGTVTRWNEIAHSETFCEDSLAVLDRRDFLAERRGLRHGGVCHGGHGREKSATTRHGNMDKIAVLLVRSVPSACPRGPVPV
jgi:hypothetical protein